VEFSEIIRKAREKRFKTAKDYFTQMQPDCTYSYYSEMERGDTVPRPALATQIIGQLGINEREGAFAWAYSSMPNEQFKQFFDLNPTPVKTETFYNQDTTVFLNRRHVRKFECDITYYNVLAFINCMGMDGPVSVSAICSKFNLPRPRIIRTLSWLHEECLIDGNASEGYKTEKDRLFLPRTKEFQPFKHNLLRHFLEQHLESEKIALNDTSAQQENQSPLDQPFSISGTVLLNEGQVAEARKNFERLMLTLKPSTQDVEPGSEPVTIGFYLSKRRWKTSEDAQE
jgi:hypothetical protein